MIVEYLGDRIPQQGNAAPNWLIKGSPFSDPDDNTMIGFLDSAHAYKLPVSVKVLSGAAELKERCQDIHVRYPFTDVDDGSTLTTGEVDTMVDTVIAARDIGGAGTPCKTSTSQKLIDDTDSVYALRYFTRTLKIDASAGNVTVDLETAVGCAGLRHTFINTTASGVNTVTLDPAGTETINGAATDTSLNTMYDTMTIESDGANWLIVGGPEVGFLKNTAANYTTQGEQKICVTNTDAARTITLGTATLKGGFEVVIKDTSNGAETNNITIDTEGPETIEGVASIVITSNRGAARIFSDGSNWFTF